MMIFCYMYVINWRSQWFMHIHNVISIIKSQTSNTYALATLNYVAMVTNRCKSSSVFSILSHTHTLIIYLTTNQLRISTTYAHSLINDWIYIAPGTVDGVSTGLNIINWSTNYLYSQRRYRWPRASNAICLISGFLIIHYHPVTSTWPESYSEFVFVTFIII